MHEQCKVMNFSRAIATEIAFRYYDSVWKCVFVYVTEILTWKWIDEHK